MSLTDNTIHPVFDTNLSANTTQLDFDMNLAANTTQLDFDMNLTAITTQLDFDMNMTINLTHLNSDMNVVVNTTHFDSGMFVAINTTQLDFVSSTHPFTESTPWDLYNSSNFSDSTSTRENYFDRDETLAVVEIAVLSSILYMALFGNIFVLGVLRMRRQKLTRMQWFIVHLSLADIFVAVFQVLPQLIMDITNTFHGDDVICRFVRYVSTKLNIKKNIS